MIKGCSRRMIVLKDTGSELFDEAYFMLKSGKLPKKPGGEKDFIAEASKGVADASSEIKPAAKSSRKPAFFLGFFAGVCLCAAVFLVSGII